MDGLIHVANDIKGEHSKTLELYEKTFLIRRVSSPFEFSMDNIGSPKKSKCSSTSRDKIERNLGHP